MASSRGYPSYSSGGGGKHKRSLSPYTGAEMGRVPSNGSYSSRRSATAVSPVASSPDGAAPFPESPGGEITSALNSFNFNANSEQQPYQTHNYNEQQHQQLYYTQSPQYIDPAGGSYHQTQSVSSATAAVVGSPPQEDEWCQYYNFIPTVEPGQVPYWQLKDGYTPSATYPRTIPIPQEVEATAPRGASENQNLNTCLAPGCEAKPFKRKADLERHYQQVHWTVKQAYPCDYARCPRATECFHRRDHCRDHYREYHKEDLIRRSSSSGSSSSSSSRSGGSGGGKKETPEWWADRGISKKWWRCSKCLQRISIQKDRFECPTCKATCEADRRRHRGYP